MQCPQCGTANADDARFCASCGAALTGAEPASAAPAAETAAPVFAPPPSAPSGYAPPPAGEPAYAPAPAATPAYAPAVPPPAVAAPPKKKRGCLIAAVIVAFLLLCCCGAIAAGYFGLTKLAKPNDLGVSYDQKDYDSATQKLGVDVSNAGPDSVTAQGGGTDAGTGEVVTPESDGSGGGTDATTGDGTAGGTSGGGAGGGTRSAAVVQSGPAAGTTVVYEGSVPVDTEITNEEFSALISLNHYSPNWLVKDMQVRFGDGNSIEMAGFIEYEGARYPVYAAGTVQLTGPRSVGGSASALKVAGYDVPPEYYEFAEQFLAGLMNEWLGQMEGLNLEELEISEGAVRIRGTVPASVVRVPATP